VTLRRKILAGYALLSVLLGLVFALAVVNLLSLGRASDAILKENYRSILAAENMIEAVERQDSGVLLILFGERAPGLSQFEEKTGEVRRWLELARGNVTLPGEAEQVERIGADYAAYLATVRRVSGQGAEASAAAARPQLYREVVFPDFLRVRADCLELRRMNEEAMTAASQRAARVGEEAVWSTVFGASFALLTALALGLFLSERLTRPLRRMTEAVGRIARADYSDRVEVETGDELGVLAAKFNTMIVELARFHELNIGQVLAEKQKLESVLGSIEDGLVVLGRELEVTDLNRAAAELFGVEQERARGRALAEILRDRRVLSLVEGTARTGTPPEIAEDERYLTVQRGERASHYSFGITAIRPNGGAPAGVVLLLRDVTRLKEVERLKSEFVMAASHELRTPLTGIGMSIDLLLEQVASQLSPRQRELLQAAHEEVSRLRVLVDELLDLSRIESGSIQLEPAAVRVAEVVRRIHTIFEGQLEEKGATLVLEGLDLLPAAWSDAAKITWVFTNLVSNSLRYLTPGGWIRVFGRVEGAEIRLSVADNGPGIPPGDRLRVFERFERVKGRKGGTGLGLAISREIVRAHGGRIWVEASGPPGATISFTLPLAHPQAQGRRGAA
jgi:two-component system, NtrC family, sensor histidine kinase KinB